jgi:hypothetical protein
MRLGLGLKHKNDYVELQQQMQSHLALLLISTAKSNLACSSTCCTVLHRSNAATWRVAALLTYRCGVLKDT